jgi:exosome complex component RRP42
MNGSVVTEAKGAISESEAAYVRASVAADVRSDGRARLRFRPCVLETGLLPQANGSARLRLGDTDVLVSVKLEIGEPLLSAPDSGRLSVSVECCPSASPEFEGRGAAVVQAELARAMERLLLSGGGGHGRRTSSCPSAAPATPAVQTGGSSGSGALDMQQLCVVHGEQVWVVYVDAMVLDSDGNLFDALSLCIRAALFQTRVGVCMCSCV